mmetsp:Transcript_63972/g.187674  ORF Transcript_63972/g.187674 Transcript_63972/m.187674 type:complete len:212 (-) Transcript_63972:25-660(-)
MLPGGVPDRSSQVAGGCGAGGLRHCGLLLLLLLLHLSAPPGLCCHRRLVSLLPLLIDRGALVGRGVDALRSVVLNDVLGHDVVLVAEDSHVLRLVLVRGGILVGDVASGVGGVLVVIVHVQLAVPRRLVPLHEARGCVVGGEVGKGAEVGGEGLAGGRLGRLRSLLGLPGEGRHEERGGPQRRQQRDGSGGTDHGHNLALEGEGNEERTRL